MSTFTIDNDNNILADLKSARAGDIGGAPQFSTQEELSQIAASWSSSKLVDLWNSFAGVPPFGELRPVKKFENRLVATTRIWQAIQRLAPKDAGGGPQIAQEPPMQPKAKQATTKAPKALTAPRNGSKTAEILVLLGRTTGATLAQIMKATGWQAHSVRGFLSRKIGKEMGLKLESFRAEDKQRTYRLLT